MRKLITVPMVLALISPVLAQSPETRSGAKITVKLVTLSDAGFARLTKDVPGFASAVNGATLGFDAVQAAKLQLLLQAQPDVNILQAPAISLGSGQPGRVGIGQDRTFTTELIPQLVAGQTVDVPKTETVFEGFEIKVTPTVAADQSAIHLSLGTTLTAIDPQIPLVPVTRSITPVFEGGSQGVPVPFTQFVQKPVVQSSAVQVQLPLTTGMVAAYMLGAQTVPQRTESGPPVLSRIPYVNRMFKTTPIQPETRHALVLVSAEACQVATGREFAEEYRKAIREGRPEDAKQWAAKALAADPACFAK